MHGHTLSEQFLNYNPDEEYIALSKAGGIEICTHQDFEISDVHNVNAVIARLRICPEERTLFLRYADNRYSNDLQKTTVANQRYIDRILKVFNPNNTERDAIEIKAQITQDLDNNIITNNPDDKEAIRQEIKIHTTILHYILTYSCYINTNTTPSMQRKFVRNPSETAQDLYDTLSGPAIFRGLNS